MKNISPTIARQQLVAYFRIILRQCFDGQMEVPFLFMDHNNPLGADAPMEFVFLSGRPTIKVSKEKLTVFLSEDLFSELCEMVVLCWLNAEGKLPTRDNSEFFSKLEYVNKHAKPVFLDIMG